MSPVVLQPLPQTQALNNATFRLPPFDRSVPELFDWHLDNNPSHSIYIYADDAGNLVNVLWPDAVYAMHRAAWMANSLVTTQKTAHNDPPVVAILAASDSITFFSIIMGIMRAGFVPFPIGIRNSPAAIAHLLKKSNAKYLFVGRDAPIQVLAEACIKMSGESISTKQMPIFEDLFGDQDPPEFFAPLDVQPETPALIIHSSGSTAFPKAIIISHLRLLRGSAGPFFGEVDLCGKYFGGHGLPMYHGMAVLQTMWSATCGCISVNFKPQHPAVIPSPEAVIQTSIATNCDLVFTVPAFLSYWSKKPEYVSFLSKVEAVMFAGGPLNKIVGDELAKKGVNLILLYGLTEGGYVTPTIPNPPGMDWQWFRLSPQLETRLVPTGENGYAELVLLDGPHMAPSLFNGSLHGEDAYFTGDILAPHPSTPNLWTVYARVDEIIVHSTGEKTNPVPLEVILLQDPHVHSAIFFGREKFNAGVLVMPEPQYAFDSSDVSKLAEFRNLVWPTIERMNTLAPKHSHIFKEMILITSPSKPFTFTGKGTPRRIPILQDYETEVGDIYAAFEQSSQSSLTPPTSWTKETTYEFIHKIVVGLLNTELSGEDDLFQKGCDSLQATWIRNTLLKAVRDSTKLETRDAPSLLVYQCPSINKLAEYIQDFIKNKGIIASSEGSSSSIDEMKAIVSNLTSNYAQRPQGQGTTYPTTSDSTITILVSGTTGYLGSILLDQLLDLPNVSRIFALNRPPPPPTGGGGGGGCSSIKERHERIFKLQELSLDKLDDPRISFVEGTALTILQQPADVLNIMLSSVTHIIHNAWTVDFNAPLKRFQQEIEGTRTLADFALASKLPTPPTISLISSVAVLGSAKPPLEQTVTAESASIGLGYAESKWCAEAILDDVASKTNVDINIIRVGQLCGGHWNVREWFPSLIKSSVASGVLPLARGLFPAIPTEIASKAIIELTLRQSESPPPRPTTTNAEVYHVVHPHPIQFNELMEQFSISLGIPTIPLDEWTKKLTLGITEPTEEQVDSSPALRLRQTFARAVEIDHNTGGGGDTHGAMGLPMVSVATTLGKSKVLGGLVSGLPIVEYVERWIGFWRGCGFL